MTALVERAHCPDCGTELASDGASAGLCARCLLSLALVASRLEPTEDVGSEAPTLEGPAAGRILGERYQMREMLGRGGMGEVWRAFDLKLRVDVALKSVRPERLESEKARDLLRQEVRSAREVVSPNVCRIFDLVVEDGRELVSMEYIDGTTLTETLRERGPLELQDAREIASQFLAGLEAIHQAGLVHRDFKPENVMLTRAGRVVVMDFGLAKGLAERGTGTVAGTPAYMAPEQSRGDVQDARTDVFAAAVVLAEMLTVGGEDPLTARRALWKGVRETPPQVPDGPWADVLKRALDPDPEVRPASAHTLARSLEELTLRLPGSEEERPYPGLASFTEEDAEYFFGREAEIEAVWKKLKRPRLLALIGPSGTGKSSFIGAGLLPTLPSSWAALMATPGHRPFQSLAQALMPAFASDMGVMKEFLRFEEADTAVDLVSRWRQSHEHALIVLDQFEELFTLNPPEVQAAFAALLERLVLEGDVHVLLSLRDDFLVECQHHEALAPILSELTVLRPLSDSALRRALVQPALACGYRFEDEALVGEMLAEVGQERGALPLLAFAASRLWEKRDQERGLLTREAYDEIGGVAGALAQHAEATLERIGTHRTPLVRELFRNLVTAQGTRAVREREELLSVFGRGEGKAADSVQTESDGSGGIQKERAEAEEVLRSLVDARLLTSFERAGDDSGEGRQEIEIIHESLLSRWPRLVRWQTQDADGAQLRDQLRQAAQAWEDRGRPEDLLWSGTAFRDFAVWKERYSGGLTSAEEAFARAAEHHAGRRRRRRRLVVAGLVAAAASIALVTSVLWQRSEAAREHAEAETLRAEASKLLALGQLDLEKNPTAALAYAIRSLELADTLVGRLFALRAAQQGPPAFVHQPRFDVYQTTFSANGEALGVGGFSGAQVLFPEGQSPLILDDFPNLGLGTGSIDVALRPDARVVVTDRGNGDTRAWSVPDGREIWRRQTEEGLRALKPKGDVFYTSTTVGQKEVIRRWSFSGDSEVVARLAPTNTYDVHGSLLAYPLGRQVRIRTLEGPDSDILVGEHQEEIRALAFNSDGSVLAARDGSGEIRLWPRPGSGGHPARSSSKGGGGEVAFDPTGRWLLVTDTSEDLAEAQVRDLRGPPGAAPISLRRGPLFAWPGVAFHPSGRWLATSHRSETTLWWLGGRRPHVLRGHEGRVDSVAFTLDGTSLLSGSGWPERVLRSWPLSAAATEGSRVVAEGADVAHMEMAPGADRLLAAGGRRILAVPLDGRAVREVARFPRNINIVAVALSADGRHVATAPLHGPTEERTVRVWDVESGDMRVLGALPGAETGIEGNVWSLDWVDEGRLLASVFPIGLVAFDLDGSPGTLVEPGLNGGAVMSSDGQSGAGVWLRPEDQVASAYPGSLVRFWLDGRPREVLRSHGDRVCHRCVALDPTGTLVASASGDGVVRIGPVTGEEPHVYFGHEELVMQLAFSPDGQWLASAGGRDRTVRLWPVPDVTRTPLHALPYEQLLDRLRSITNVRAVADVDSATGYTLEIGPFPGWAKEPEL